MTKKRKRQVQKAKGKRRARRKLEKAELSVVIARAAEGLDEKFGPDWREDSLLVAKFQGVIEQEYHAARHHGIVVGPTLARGPVTK